MFTKSDYEKLQQIMEESPEKKELLTRLLASHQMTISSISHEIRNPLTLVYSTIQLMESKHPQVTNIPYWSDLRNDIEYMKLLLEELSSYNNGEFLSLSTIDTDTFFKTLALSFASSLIETNIQFVSNIESPLPLLSGDAVKLKEVFLNLLKNAREALDFTNSQNDRDSLSPTIHLSVTCENRSCDFPSILVTIKDNGCGIDDTKLPHIFEPFVTYKRNGTGLGLPLSAKIIHAHHGSIHVSSVPGVHTTFTVSLPVQKNA